MIDDLPSLVAAIQTLPGLAAIAWATAGAVAMMLFVIGLMRDWPENPPRCRNRRLELLDQLKRRRADATVARQQERRP